MHKLLLALALAGIVPTGVRAQVIPNGRARMLDLRADTCGYLFSAGYAWASDIGNGDPDAAEYAYDTLQLFLEH